MRHALSLTSAALVTLPLLGAGCNQQPMVADFPSAIQQTDPVQLPPPPRWQDGLATDYYEVAAMVTEANRKGWLSSTFLYEYDLVDQPPGSILLYPNGDLSETPEEIGFSGDIPGTILPCFDSRQKAVFGFPSQGIETRFVSFQLLAQQEGPLGITATIGGSWPRASQWEVTVRNVITSNGVNAFVGVLAMPLSSGWPYDVQRSNDHLQIIELQVPPAVGQVCLQQAIIVTE